MNQTTYDLSRMELDIESCTNVYSFISLHKHLLPDVLIEEQKEALLTSFYFNFYNEDGEIGTHRYMDYKGMCIADINHVVDDNWSHVMHVFKDRIYEAVEDEIKDDYKTEIEDDIKSDYEDELIKKVNDKTKKTHNDCGRRDENMLMMELVGEILNSHSVTKDGVMVSKEEFLKELKHRHMECTVENVFNYF